MTIMQVEDSATCVVPVFKAVLAHSVVNVMQVTEKASASVLRTLAAGESVDEGTLT
ncbi:hypothetical protein PF003_g23836 [Phytophthora fragariae]|nr:hypothetical protein PF003_g23836 [Phytophthora fragariae]KAE8919943.1 hypothetical protein PF009_g29757 [Phytophthora fragariae]